MKLGSNRLKQTLAAGDQAIGCWQFTASADVTEILSLCGFDALLIDHEHTPASLGEAVAKLRAAGRSQTTCLMRVPWNDPVYLKRALDIGVEGVMVPMVENAAQAAAAVAACRYPPQGHRGAAYTVTRAGGWGTITDYPQQAASELLIIVQIESLAAIGQIPDIAAVDGVDMLLIGPLDLSGSAGTLGDFANPRFTEALEQAERSIKRSGKWLGGVAGDRDGTRELLARGYDLVMATSDMHLLRDGGLDLIAALKAD